VKEFEERAIGLSKSLQRQEMWDATSPGNVPALEQEALENIPPAREESQDPCRQGVS